MGKDSRQNLRAQIVVLLLSDCKPQILGFLILLLLVVEELPALDLCVPSLGLSGNLLLVLLSQILGVSSG